MPQVIWVAELTRFPGRNVQVTHSQPSNARSESVVAINPINSAQMVAASKRFTDPAKYEFSVAAYSSVDGGVTWSEAPPLALHAGWGGITDPVVAWDSMGGAYLVALPIPPGAGPELGVAVYRSPDGGVTWGPPELIHGSVDQLKNDDKQTVTADNFSSSLHFGNVYVAWYCGDGSLRFARTTDGGKTWTGTGTDNPGSQLASDSFAPAASVAPDGTVYIAYIVRGAGIIKLVTSNDGGNSFSAALQPVAEGINELASPPLLRGPDGYSQLPGGKFRVLTLPACTTPADGVVVVAWADYRENVARIYYRRSTDGGATWEGPRSGQPLLGATTADPIQHHFHPQLAHLPSGEIGCAYYEFGPKSASPNAVPLIDVVLRVSLDRGQDFDQALTITDEPWDPAVDAPFSMSAEGATFIGEYFGLAGCDKGFQVLWTDTRTGVQEIFTNGVAIRWLPRVEGSSFVEILAGIIEGGGGVIMTPRGPERVPPPRPDREILVGLLIYQAAGSVPDAYGRQIQRMAMDMISEIAQSTARGPGDAARVAAGAARPPAAADVQAV